MFSKANLRRVALTALKAFGAAEVAFFVANEAQILHSTPSDLRTLGVAALVAGGDAAFKVVQAFLEEAPSAGA
jgi:hypothetical protein